MLTFQKTSLEGKSEYSPQNQKFLDSHFLEWNHKRRGQPHTRWEIALGKRWWWRPLELVGQVPVEVKVVYWRRPFPSFPQLGLLKLQAGLSTEYTFWLQPWIHGTKRQCFKHFVFLFLFFFFSYFVFGNKDKVIPSLNWVSLRVLVSFQVS